MPVLSPEERVGSLFAGRYRLTRILGSGGTGVVFEASHAWTGRTVAVKLLKPHLAEEPSFVRRFLQEARSASEVLHQHVVQVFDLGAEEDGAVFLAMERFEGEALSSRLEAAGALPLDEALRVLVPVMDALALAHERGIIHRDLKPANVFLHRDGRGRMVPKLLDFGLSKIVDAQWGQATQTGTILGTPYYMAPEQAEGAVDQGPACDVWSMGVLLYQTLSGELPFTASSPAALLLRILQSRPRPLAERADVPAPVAAVVDRALSADRAGRYADMGAMIEALRDACAAAGVAFPEVASDAARVEFDPGPRRARRPRWVVGAVGAAALALAGFAAWAAAPRGSTPAFAAPDGAQERGGVEASSSQARSVAVAGGWDREAAGRRAAEASVGSDSVGPEPGARPEVGGRAAAEAGGRGAALARSDGRDGSGAGAAMGSAAEAGSGAGAGTGSGAGAGAGAGSETGAWSGAETAAGTGTGSQSETVAGAGTGTGTGSGSETGAGAGSGTGTGRGSGAAGEDLAVPPRPAGALPEVTRQW